MNGEVIIDEFIFWKRFIADKEEQGEIVSEKMHEALDNAERKVFFYLLDKYQIDNIFLTQHPVH